MTWKLTDWPLLLKADPETLRERILTAYAANKGNVEDTLRDLDVAPYTFYQYAKKLSIQEKLHEIRIKHHSERDHKRRGGRSFGFTMPRRK